MNLLNLTINRKFLNSLREWFSTNSQYLILFTLFLISIVTFRTYYLNHIGLAYNDARSHLDIARRVVEGLKPGFAQIGSVWLPLPHILMIPTIWNDFFWHSGLAGALVSMISFVATGVVIYNYLKTLGVGLLGRYFGVIVFAANLNILYLTSTAMTELLLLATMTTGSYYLLNWAKSDKYLDLIKAAFFIMLSSVTRYDGWFLLLTAVILIFFITLKNKGYKEMEGKVLLFLTLGSLGIILWLLWNLLIFKDPLYFAFGPFSAHTQQSQLSTAGNLPTKSNILLSIQIYLYALIYNSYAYPVIMGIFGAIALWLTKIKYEIKVISLALFAPLIFNIIALYFGHSVLFIQGISGNTWFNVRYGIMMAPTIAIFSGYLIDRIKPLKWTFIGLFLFTIFFAFTSADAVTIDDARVGSSQKNVTEVSGWLKDNASQQEGFILISAASHDAIIFSSELPMKKYIHEGTGAYWQAATTNPDLWARWIIMRTYDDSDLTWKAVNKKPGFAKYELIESYPFADIYELKSEYLKDLNTKAIFSKQK
jgi:hypothetical protein